MTIAERILFVDDEPAILAAYRRTLRSMPGIETAASGDEGLRLIASGGPFAVIVADMHMPGMDGIAFLARAKAASPDSVRIMLTGANDQSVAVSAINQGEIFRFLGKPCPAELLTRAIIDGVKQYRLVMGERDLLEKTLNGSIGLITDLLSLIDADTFGEAERLRPMVKTLCAHLRVEETWAIEMALMLAGIGRLTVPPRVIVKQQSKQPLTADEADAIRRVPEIGSMLLAQVPRLEPVSRIVLYQDKHMDGSGFPPDSVKGDQIPIGARILVAVRDMVRGQHEGMTAAESLGVLRSRGGWYDPAVIAAIDECLIPRTERRERPAEIVEIPLAQVHVGWRLCKPVVGDDGVTLIGRGAIVTQALLERMLNFHRLGGVREPITVEKLRPQEPSS